MLSGLTKKTCISVIVINNEPILSSMLAAGVVQDTFVGEAGEGERGRRSGDDWRLLLPPGPQITNTRTCIRNVGTYMWLLPRHRDQKYFP